jgi:hypothetical protein
MMPPLAADGPELFIELLRIVRGCQQGGSQSMPFFLSHPITGGFRFVRRHEARAPEKKPVLR